MVLPPQPPNKTRSHPSFQSEISENENLEEEAATLDVDSPQFSDRSRFPSFVVNSDPAGPVVDIDAYLASLPGDTTVVDDENASGGSENSGDKGDEGGGSGSGSGSNGGSNGSNGSDGKGGGSDSGRDQAAAAAQTPPRAHRGSHRRSVTWDASITASSPQLKLAVEVARRDLGAQESEGHLLLSDDDSDITEEETTHSSHDSDIDHGANDSNSGSDSGSNDDAESDDSGNNLPSTAKPMKSRGSLASNTIQNAHRRLSLGLIGQTEFNRIMAHDEARSKAERRRSLALTRKKSPLRRSKAERLEESRRAFSRRKSIHSMVCAFELADATRVPEEASDDSADADSDPEPDFGRQRSAPAELTEPRRPRPSAMMQQQRTPPRTKSFRPMATPPSLLKATTAATPPPRGRTTPADDDDDAPSPIVRVTNPATGQRFAFDMSTGAFVKVGEDEAPPPLGEGKDAPATAAAALWTQEIEASTGRPYWYCAATGVSTFTKPEPTKEAMLHSGGGLMPSLEERIQRTPGLAALRRQMSQRMEFDDDEANYDFSGDDEVWDEDEWQ